MRTWFWTLILFVTAVALALVLREYAGNVYVVTPHHIVRSSLVFFVLSILAIFIGLHVLLRLLGWVSDAPGRFGLWRSRRAQNRDREMLEHGWIHILEGRYDEAERKLSRLLGKTKNPRSKVVAALAVARAAHFQGEFQRRDEALKIARASSSEDALLSDATAVAAAEMYLDQNQPQKAVDLLQPVQDASSRHFHATRLLQRAYRQLGQYDRVYELTRLLVRRSAIDVQEAQASISWAAAERIRAGGIEHFKTLWSDLKSDEKLLPAVAMQAALVLDSAEQFDEAARVLEPAIKQSFDADLLGAYAQCSPEHVSRRLAKAEEWLRTEPNNPILLTALGQLCLTSSLWGQAEHYLLRSLKLRQDLRSYALLGNLYDALGRQSEAINYWRKAATVAGTLPVLFAKGALPAAQIHLDPEVYDGLDEDGSVSQYTVIAPDAASAVASDLPDNRPLPVRVPPVAPSADEISSPEPEDQAHEYFDSAPIPGVDVSQTSDRSPRAND